MSGDWTDLLNRTIQAVYRSVQDADPWHSCLARLVEYFQATNAAIMLRPTYANAGGHAMWFAPPALPGHAASHAQWEASDPFVHVPPDRVFILSDLSTAARVNHSEVSARAGQHGLPADATHVMGVDISTQNEMVIRLRLFRSRQATAFGADDQRRLTLFVPHVRQAMTLLTHLNSKESQKQIYEDGLERLNIGVIVLDEQARLLRANGTASQMLDLADGLKLMDRQLAASSVSETRALRSLLALARERPSHVAAMCLSRPSGRRKLAAVVRGLPRLKGAEGLAGPAVAVFLRDPDAVTVPAHDIARQLFDFTPAEAQLALELANGLSLDDAACKLGILRNTARAHLRAIFSKTGVTRQSELIRVLLNGVLNLSSMAS